MYNDIYNNMMGVFCDRLKFGSTAALDCRTCQNKNRFHISSYSFRGNYFFFEFGNPKVTIHKAKGYIK